MFLNKRFFDGAQIEIGALPVVGVSSINGNASGLLETVIVSEFAFSIIVDSSASGPFATASIVSFNGSAFVSGSGSYLFSTATVNPFSGSASGSSSTSGSLQSVSTSSFSGSSSGSGNAQSAVPSISVISPIFDYSGSATVSSSLFYFREQIQSIASNSISEVPISGSSSEEVSEILIFTFSGRSAAEYQIWARSRVKKNIISSVKIRKINSGRASGYTRPIN